MPAGRDYAPFEPIRMAWVMPEALVLVIALIFVVRQIRRAARPDDEYEHADAPASSHFRRPPNKRHNDNRSTLRNFRRVEKSRSEEAIEDESEEPRKRKRDSRVQRKHAPDESHSKVNQKDDDEAFRRREKRDNATRNSTRGANAASTRTNHIVSSSMNEAPRPIQRAESTTSLSSGSNLRVLISPAGHVSSQSMQRAKSNTALSSGSRFYSEIVLARSKIAGIMAPDTPLTSARSFTRASAKPHVVTSPLGDVSRPVQRAKSTTALSSGSRF